MSLNVSSPIPQRIDLRHNKAVKRGVEAPLFESSTFIYDLPESFDSMRIFEITEVYRYAFPIICGYVKDT